MTFAPRKRSSLRRSTLNGSAMVTHKRISLGRANHRKANSGVAARHLDNPRLFLSYPDFSAASITPSTNRSFTEPRGLKASILTKSPAKAPDD